MSDSLVLWLLWRCVCVSPGDVIELKCPAGQTFSQEEVTKALEEHKPAVLFLCQVRGIR